MQIGTLLMTLVASSIALAHGPSKTTKESTATLREANASTTSTAAAPTAASNGQKYELNVDGMHCDACVKNLTKELEAMTDVEKGTVKVDLKGNKAVLTLKTGAPTAAGVETLKKTLNDKLTAAGFTVTDVKMIN